MGSINCKLGKWVKTAWNIYYICVQNGAFEWKDFSHFYGKNIGKIQFN